jgi:hypothetical protein
MGDKATLIVKGLPQQENRPILVEKGFCTVPRFAFLFKDRVRNPEHALHE